MATFIATVMYELPVVNEVLPEEISWMSHNSTYIFLKALVKSLQFRYTHDAPPQFYV